MDKLVILIPTYNEAVSIVELLEKLSTFRTNSQRLFDIVVIDDNSPDNTANIVDNFLATTNLYNKWFFWNVGSISDGNIKVTCDKWTKEFFAHNRATIKATFIEAFDFLPRNYGFFVDQSSYQITGIDAGSIFGRWIGGGTASYGLSFQEATFLYAKNLTADTASFGIDVLPAGPEIYFLEADNAAELSIVFNGSDYVIGTASESDYFASISAQVYGWDRDFQVDWWGD